MATVSEIRGELSKARPEEWKAFIEKYETDSRTGVIKLCLLYTSPSPRDRQKMNVLKIC